jgi:hypothetical protein
MAFSGASLVALGVVAGYVDIASKFDLAFIDDYYDFFALIALIGLVLVFVGCIGWARFCDKQHRALMALSVFTAPWAALLLGYPIAGTNIHGPAAPVMMLIVPATILAVVLLIMNAFSSRKA